MNKLTTIISGIAMAFILSVTGMCSITAKAAGEEVYDVGIIAEDSMGNQLVLAFFSDDVSQYAYITDGYESVYASYEVKDVYIDEIGIGQKFTVGGADITYFEYNYKMYLVTDDDILYEAHYLTEYEVDEIRDLMGDLVG